MEVIKRNGTIVMYDGSKIILAIEKAMADVSINISSDIANEIEEDIMATISGSDDSWTVEEIQDEIEKQLTRNEKTFDVGKQFILYRNEKKKRRKENKPWKYKLLSKEFLSKYKKIKNPMNPLGSFVYYRTYSRWLPDEKRREYWWETVARAVDYNCSLAYTTIEEAEELYDNIFNLKQFLSGRTLWVGGTDVAKYYKTSNFNCATIKIDSFDAYKDMFYLLMVGSGVGFRVLKEDVSQLPNIRNNINILHEHYNAVPKYARREYTGLDFAGDVATITIGDSKEAWTQALDFFLKVHWSKEYRKVNNIIINYNNIRPYGERLNTFGGTASGHESMYNMMQKFETTIKNSNGKLKPIEAMDLANIIAENVVVGGRQTKIA